MLNGQITGFTGPLQGKHHERAVKHRKDILDRLKEKYGENLEGVFLIKEIDYIITESYKEFYKSGYNDRIYEVG